MSQNFKIDFKLSKGNLHVSPEGDFDNFSAYALVHLLHEQYEGKGKVFINTQKLCKICPHGCIAEIKLLHPGNWLLLVKHQEAYHDNEVCDTIIKASSLTFNVR
jgi:hypothetical protein